MVNIPFASESNAPLRVSLQFYPGLSSFADVGVESDATTGATDSEDEHTLAAFGDVSLRSASRLINRLRLNVKRPLFPSSKKHTSVQEAQFSPKSQTSGSSKTSSLLSPSFFIEALKNSLRLGKRRATQRSAVEPETPSPPVASPESTSSDSSASYWPYDCDLRQPVIVKAMPSVAEVPQPAKGWKKLPPRLPIPKWDVDD
ncbi:hypothetical protein DFH29DRAFT_1080811 [Suillus ampliporus]|nr:hypothetical protein DFH29DRAFT_1080811 [Suillus ampliporus]